MKQIDKMTKDNWKDMGKVTKDLQRATIRDCRISKQLLLKLIPFILH